MIVFELLGILVVLGIVYLGLTKLSRVRMEREYTEAELEKFLREKQEKLRAIDEKESN